jgi:hypothetical protein
MRRSGRGPYRGRGVAERPNHGKAEEAGTADERGWRRRGSPVDAAARVRVLGRRGFLFVGRWVTLACGPREEKLARDLGEALCVGEEREGWSEKNVSRLSGSECSHYQEQASIAPY